MIDPFKPRPRGARKFSETSKIATAIKANAVPTRYGYVTSFDGTKLFYSVEGQGKPLVFCYGLVCSSLHWTYQIDYFRQNYQVIWFDYRGHQNSSIPDDIGSLSIENLARDLGIVLDELQIKEAVVLGHSMGVNVALEFYRQQPERVKSLILANGTPKKPLETLFESNASQAMFVALKKAYSLSPELSKKIWAMQKANPITKSLVTLGGFNPDLSASEDIDLYIKQVLEMDPGILISLIDNYERVDSTPWLHEIKVPTLIFGGDRDHITPIGQQELMHQLIPESEFEVIRHGSHCCQMDLPEHINLRIEKFLETHQY